MADRIRPLGTVTPVFRGDEKYPDEVLVPMADGHVVRYKIDEERKEKHFVEAMDILQRLPLFGGRKHRMGQKIQMP